MNLLCRTGLHRYEHCRCTRCGAGRDTDHVWNGCKCAVCGKVRDENHSWNGCRCTVCHAVRDEGHRWDGCTCAICGRKREEGHVWDGCICLKCGKVRFYENDEDGRIRNAHDWDGCVCRKCGTTRDKWHQMPPDILARELAKNISGKVLSPGLNLRFRCLRCRRDITLTGGKDYCPECFCPVGSSLEYTDSPTVMKRVYRCAECGYQAERTFSDG